MINKIWKILTSAERRNAILLLGLMCVGMLLETLGVGMVIPAIALLTQSDLLQNSPALRPLLLTLGNPSQETLVIGGMLLLVAVYFIKTLFLVFLTWRQAHFAFSLQAQISQRLFTAYLEQPYTFHLQRNSAQLVRNVINEVSLFTSNGVIPGMLLLSESLVLIGLCILLFFIEPLGMVVVASVLGAAIFGFYRLTRVRITSWGKKRQHHDGLRSQHLQQGLGGVKDVKLLGRERDFLMQYQTHNLQSAKAAQHQSVSQQLPRLGLEFLAVSGLALLVVSMLFQGKSMADIVPTLGLFAAAAFRLMPSANRVLSTMQSLRYVHSVIDTLYAELTLTPAEFDKPNKSDIDSRFCTDVRLSNISYTYSGAQIEAISNLTLSIRKGECVGFIGASGSGKSTLVDIILGLLPPDSGGVMVDGENINANLRNWQNKIGYVPQTIYLTDDTLRRNIAFGIPNELVDDIAVERAIESAQLKELVDGLPDGIETVVGERGIRLSGGQRQRIGIARSLYHDPSVLVLDEATSALDIETEASVMTAIKALKGTKTIIIVAHRLSTVEHCDCLYRFEAGRLVQAGAPSEILNIQTNFNDNA